MNNLDFALNEVYLPTLNVDNFTGSSISDINIGERMAIIIKAFVELDRSKREDEVAVYSGENISQKKLQKQVSKHKKGQPDPPLVDPTVLQELNDAKEKVSRSLSHIMRYIDQVSSTMSLIDFKEGRSYSSSIASQSQLQTSLTGSTEGAGIAGYPPTLAVPVPKDKAGIFFLQKTIYECLDTILPSGQKSMQVLDSICKYTLHIDQRVRTSAMETLVKIAHQEGVEEVVRRLGRFLISIEDRFFDAITGSMNVDGPANNRKGVMSLYVDILGLWIYELTQQQQQMKAKGSSDLSSWSLNVTRLCEEIEGIGLIFLCNSSSAIRVLALKILKVVPMAAKVKNDANQPDRGYYVIDIFETAGPELLRRSSLRNQFSDTTKKLIDSKLSTSSDTLTSIISSDSQRDFSIWIQTFPFFIQLCHERCQTTVVICTSTLLSRLSRLHSYITYCSDLPRSAVSQSFTSLNSGMTVNKGVTTKWTFPDQMISNWKMYLMFTFCILPQLNSQRTTEKARLRIFDEQDQIRDATELFQHIYPFLYCENTAVRHAVVTALGCIHFSMYGDLLRYLRMPIQSICEEMKSKLSNRTIGLSKKAMKKAEKLRTEIAHVLFLVADFVKYDTLVDDSLIEMIRVYIHETLHYLGHPDIQQDWDHQMLRYYFCGFIERIYYNLSKSTIVTKLIRFHTRVSLFKLFEEWCGHGQHSAATREREAKMMFNILDQVKDFQERGALNSILEEQRKGKRQYSVFHY
jgi:hypothetical protein